MEFAKLVAGAAFAISLMSAASASAAVTYSYKGNPYTEFLPPYYSAGDYLSIEFTLDNPLPAGFIGEIENFRGSDRPKDPIHTIGGFNVLTVATDSNGRINQWYLGSFDPCGYSMETRETGFCSTVSWWGLPDLLNFEYIIKHGLNGSPALQYAKNGEDLTFYEPPPPPLSEECPSRCPVAGGIGLNGTAPGVWSMTGSTAAVPEPGAWLLLIVGAGMTGVALRQSRRRFKVGSKLS